jgi:hypothetical protein
VQPTEHNANTASTSKAGLFAALSASLHLKGTGVPSHRRLSVVLTTPLLALFAALTLTPSLAFATGDANEASCPPSTEASPGFRTYLPDCRAYEQVTPVFKDGTEVELGVGGAGISEDGSSVLAQSLGAFGGIKNDSEIGGGTYELSRSLSGWTVAPISLPSSAYPLQLFAAASANLDSTLWVSRSPAESIAAENLYRREPGGAIAKIGPMLPPADTGGPPAGDFQTFLYNTRFRDASADLSHVLFTILECGRFGLCWPGDSSKGGLSSLYEYVGAGQPRPELVGVGDDDDLISQCATWLGSYRSEDIYNAVSADGSTVFFTAEGNDCSADAGPMVNELYARVDGVQTVAISEPSTGEAGTCASCSDTDPMPAQFAGASRDGSKTFFLTEQELLPGASGGNNLYEYDLDAPPHQHIIRVTTGTEPAKVQGVVRVSEDGSHVYFVARGRLTEGPRGGRGGSCITELSSVESAAEAIAEEQEVNHDPITTGGKCRPVIGSENLYVFERDATHPMGHMSFIATLCTGDDTSGTQADSQCPSSGSDYRDWFQSDQRRAEATPDGRFLVFQSTADLTAADRGGLPQIFEYDAATGELVWVSREDLGYAPPAGLGASEHASEVPIQGYSETTYPTVANKVSISDDGSTVIFSTVAALTREALVPASAGVESSYEYRNPVASGGSIDDGNVFLLSGESVAEGRSVEGMDPSGQDAFLVTSASLVPQDTDTQLDTYDVRSDGGFLAPDPPGDCEAQACSAPLYTPPTLSAPESAAATLGSGSTDVSPPTRSSSSLSARPRTPAQIRAANLAASLRFCRTRRDRHSRAVCAAFARRRYHALPSSNPGRRTK